MERDDVEVERNEKFHGGKVSSCSGRLLKVGERLRVPADQAPMSAVNVRVAADCVRVPSVSLRVVAVGVRVVADCVRVPAAGDFKQRIDLRLQRNACGSQRYACLLQRYSVEFVP